MLKAFLGRLFATFQPGAHERRLDEEVEQHLHELATR
jgi:hypothetical protein